MGPSAIRYAGLEDAHPGARPRRVDDWGDVALAGARGDRRGRPRAPATSAPIKQVVRAGRGARRAKRRAQGFLPLVLGGDHSIAIGTLGGMAKARGPGAVLWIDAHGDLNRPETSPTGNVHGMPLAAAFGVAGDGFASDAYPTPSVHARGARRRPLARPGRARADRASSTCASSR